MPQTRIVKVQAPDGSIIKIEGPASAADDQFIAQAKTLWKPTPAADPNQAIKDRQATYKSGAEDNRGWFEVMQDQVAKVPEALGLAHPVETLKSIGGVAADLLRSGGRFNTPRSQEALAGAVTAPIRAVPHAAQAAMTTAQGAAALGFPQQVQAPTREAWEQATTGATELLANAPVIAGGVAAVKGGVKALKPKPTQETRVNSLMQTMKSAVKDQGVAPQTIAEDARPRLQQAYQEFGLDPQRIPSKNRAGGADALGDLVRGGTPEELAKVNKVLKAEHDASVASGELPKDSVFRPHRSGSITIAAADRMVDISHRTIGESMKAFDEMYVPDAQNAVVQGLRKLAAADAKANPKLSAAYTRVADQVAAANGKVGGLNAIKVQYNKAPNRAFTPSAKIALDINPITAQMDAAALIREHLYPAVEKVATNNGKPMNGALIEAGRRETNAIVTRDGIYNEWTNAAGNHAPLTLKNWLKHTLRGHSESVPIVGSPFKRPAMMNAVGRAITGPEQSMKTFNANLREGLGPLDGFTPESVNIAPAGGGPGFQSKPPTAPPNLLNTQGGIGPTSLTGPYTGPPPPGRPPPNILDTQSGVGPSTLGEISMARPMGRGVVHPFEGEGSGVLRSGNPPPTLGDMQTRGAAQTANISRLPDIRSILAESDGAPVTMRELGKKFGGDRAAVEKAVRQAIDNGEVTVQYHDHGNALTEAQRAERGLIDGGIVDRGGGARREWIVSIEPRSTSSNMSQLQMTPGVDVKGGPGPVQLGATPAEAATIAARGRRPELLKEGKAFDEQRVVDSPLFQGRGGKQGFLGVDERAAVVDDAVNQKLQQFVAENKSGDTRLTGKSQVLPNKGGINFGMADIRRFKGGTFKMNPELANLGETPAAITKAIIKDGDNPLYRRIVKAVKPAIEEAVQKADEVSFDFGANSPGMTMGQAEAATTVRGLKHGPEVPRTPTDPGYTVKSGSAKGYTYQRAEFNDTTHNTRYWYIDKATGKELSFSSRQT